MHEGRATQLYTGADTGSDPQKAIAAPGTPIYAAARAEGLTFVGLYVYPPILADLLLPLTAFPVQVAARLWFFANVLFVLSTALLVIRLLRLPLLSASAALIVGSLFCFTPMLQCLVDGQITIFLLLLWAAGMVLYQEDWPYAAGAVFALATAIKLTPALILLPFLIWRSWRLVGAFVITLGGLALLCLWIDTPHTFAVYFIRVMPAMSGAIPYYTNFSLPAATERLITALRTGSVLPYPQGFSPAVVRIGRAASVVTSLALVALIVRAGKVANKGDRIMILGLLGLLSPILSPVSWFHAYAVAYLAFALLWHEALSRSLGTVYLVALTAVSLLLGSAVSENLMSMLVYAPAGARVAAWLQFLQLGIASALVLYRIWQMKGSMPSGMVPGDSGLPRTSLHPARSLIDRRV